MADFEQFSFSVESFSGTVRLFPLPNLVMFPQVMQPLHVFEARYRELLEDALADDGLITMATLAPGWETDYEGRPPLARVACLGRVAAHHRLEGGQYNVLLAGLRRVRLLDELPPRKSYREARVEVFDDCYPQSAPAARPLLQRELREVFLRILPEVAHGEDSLDQLLGDDVSLGTLTDVVAYMLDITTGEKVALLGEANVHRRAETLLKHLTDAAADLSPGSAGVTEFPPEFSVN